MLKKGDKARITGLVHRQDLNGQTVTLLYWCEDFERWAARCDGTGEGVRIKPVNLRDVTRGVERSSSFDLVVGEALKALVRGEHRLFHEHIPGIGEGQITRLALEEFVRIAIEMYGDPPDGIDNKEAVILAMLIDFIGKEGDSELLFHAFKAKLMKQFNFHDYGTFFTIAIVCESSPWNGYRH